MISTEQARTIADRIREAGHFPPSLTSIQRVIEAADASGAIQEGATVR